MNKYKNLLEDQLNEVNFDGDEYNDTSEKFDGLFLKLIKTMKKYKQIDTETKQMEKMYKQWEKIFRKSHTEITFDR